MNIQRIHPDLIEREQPKAQEAFDSATKGRSYNFLMTRRTVQGTNELGRQLVESIDALPLDRQMAFVAAFVIIAQESNHRIRERDIGNATEYHVLVNTDQKAESKLRLVSDCGSYRPAPQRSRCGMR